MDISTVIGLVLGTVLVTTAILIGESPMIFVNVPSILIVVGGTLAVTFIKNPLSRVFGTIKVVKNAFFSRPPQDDALIAKIVELARTARRESLLSIEKAEVDNDFLKRAIRLAVDGHEPDSIRRILSTEIAALAQRHKIGQDLMEGIATSAPAFGMIGTLIGLVNMLASMDDPASIGPAMAVAILTTLYGALIANLVASPIAEKLKYRSREEVNSRTVILEGIISIVEGDHPASVEQKLMAFLDPKKRDTAGQQQQQAA
ncbi:MAG: flagellar motor protein PomA [Acidobacteria bacterium]|nr:MAG: flagellar motor protein PomA [Acidobacteriota bacterium]